MAISRGPIPAHGLEAFNEADAAVERLAMLYRDAVGQLAARFREYAGKKRFSGKVRKYYPYLLKRVDREAARLDPRVSHGFCHDLGLYGTTVTRPDLFRDYYRDQIASLLDNHGGTIEIGTGYLSIPVHFAFGDDIAEITRGMPAEKVYGIRHHFDVPELTGIDDLIVNGTHHYDDSPVRPLALFSAPRVDYSLHRLKHYTGTAPEHFQSFVLFTNYQFYIEEFVKLGKALVARGGDASAEGYHAFVEPGDAITTADTNGDAATTGEPPRRLPQMPAYHLKRDGGEGITLINIGVGPSNAKTITDHVAVLRPHCWMMLGHCAGLRKTQRLGDYALAHAYLREDQVLDDELPISVPIPAIAEVQRALEDAVADITGFDAYDLKRLMRTGTVATVSDRNWELREYSHLAERFSQSRAIALDMESATIAANGFRFRVPYGTLLCVSDKPLHGEIKLPGMADHFYRERVNQHLQIGIRAMELLRGKGTQRLHSRKLRTFAEPAFR